MENRSKNSYYWGAFFWSTLSKVLNAIFGFISVPLLLGYFGKAEYGLLSIATACNGYMYLMDLGMNVGSVKFFSQWEAEGNREMVHKVARTNISFYLIISVINIIGLLFLAFWGENFFSVTHDQFIQLRTCFFILALFASINWVTTTFNQLLTAYKMIDYIMKVQCAIVLLKGVLIVSVFAFGLSLSDYFFYLTLLVAAAIVPYLIKCKTHGLIDNIAPATYWAEFKVVLLFSLSIFALSLFQVTATQARPIILSIFSSNGADAVADYRVIEVIPQFIITVCGTLTSVFLPKSSEMVLRNSKEEIQKYINEWTNKTTILVCVLCFPFIVGAHNILSAYVGVEYGYLSKWLSIWCLFLIVQMHSTPAFSFILANGKTKILVASTAVACLLSMILNALLCKILPVGSAVVGYMSYMLCLIGVYYYLYSRFLNLHQGQIFISFFRPFFIGIVCCILPLYVNIDGLLSNASINYRFISVLEFSFKTFIWLLPYCLLLKMSRLAFSKNS